MDLTLLHLALLTLAAFAAGLVDSIAGGGGLISLPALLWAGLPAHAAIATNKGQSVWGSGAALWSYSRHGLVRWTRTKALFPWGLFGALGGAALLLAVPQDVLKPLVLALLVAVAAFLAFRPKVIDRPHGAAEAPERPRAAAAIAFTIAAYDGFFGPGTGTFLILAFVLVLGETTLRATAEAKIVNFASNLASFTLFALCDAIVWKAALPMAVAQFTGATLGSRFTVRKGGTIVRKVVLAVAVATSVKLAWDLWSPSK